MSGDLNSRVGLRCDYITHDRFNEAIDDLNYVPDVPLYRASPDKTLKLFDICKSTGVRILNGRLYDTEKFTFISQTGASGIDFVLTRDSLFSRVSTFYVIPLHNCSFISCRFVIRIPYLCTWTGTV
mgnify:CR=1 FL=1